MNDRKGMKKTIFFIGKPNSYYRNLLDNKLYDPYLLLDVRLVLNKKKYKDYKDIFPVDFTTRESLLNSIDQIKVKPDVLISIYENYVIYKSIIGKYFGLKNIPSLDSLERSTDKIKMRESFSKYDRSISPEFREIKSREDIIKFTKTHSFPVIIKPSNLMKSLFVKKCDSLEEALQHYEKSLTQARETYAKVNTYYKEPRFLIEEYMSGKMHTVAAFVDSKGDIYQSKFIVDNLTAGDIGVKDSYLYSRSLPSTLSKSLQKSILDTSRKGIKALGLKSSPAHVEIFLTDSGPKLIEIGARVGGNRPKMFKEALQINLVNAEIASVLGGIGDSDLVCDDIKYVTVYEKFPLQNGILREITRLEDVFKLKSYHSHNQRIKIGQNCGPATEGYKFALSLTLLNSDIIQFEKDKQFIDDHVKIINY